MNHSLWEVFFFFLLGRFTLRRDDLAGAASLGDVGSPFDASPMEVEESETRGRRSVAASCAPESRVDVDSGDSEFGGGSMAKSRWNDVRCKSRKERDATNGSGCDRCSWRSRTDPDLNVRKISGTRVLFPWPPYYISGYVQSWTSKVH
jgi:hypothetical protein